MCLANIDAFAEAVDGVAVARRVRRVLAIAPANTDALFVWCSVLSGLLGRPERCHSALALIQQVDPLSYGAHVVAHFLAMFQGQYDRSVAITEAGLSYEPENFDLRVHNAWALTLCGSAERASALYGQLAVEVSGWSEGTADWCRACSRGVVGDGAGTLAAITPALRAFVATAHPLWILPLAEAVAMAGLRDEATEWLERLVFRGYLDYPHLSRDPLLANLRGFPRFERFLPIVKAKWEEAGRQLADMPPL